MAVEQGVLVTLGMAAVAGCVWLIRLEGRVNTGEKLTDQRFADLKEDVTYIRQRIDKALNGHD